MRIRHCLVWTLVGSVLCAGCLASPIAAVIPTNTARPPAPTLAVRTGPASVATAVVVATPAASSTPVPVIPTATVGAMASPTPSARTDPGSTDRPSYRMTVSADPILHRASVQMELTLADPLRLATGEIVFNVLANQSQGVFTLDQVRITRGGTLVAASLNGSVLRVVFVRASNVDEPLAIGIDYALIVPQATAAEISAVHALAWSELGELLGYWYPVLAPYALQDGWRIVPYHSIGDPIIYESADYHVTVTAPNGFTVIGSGLQGQDGTSWEFVQTECRGFALVVTNHLQLAESSVLGIPIRTYHAEAHASAAQGVLWAVGEGLPLFQQAYGPYPYHDLVIVEAEQFGGMEYSGLITFSSEWFAEYQPPAADSSFGADYLIRFIVHELGHQWWYGGVANDQAHEPWLDESLARYGEWLYYATLHPESLAWWEAPSAGMATQFIDRPIYEFADTASYVQAIYVSGTRLLLELQAAAGREHFLQFLQEYYRQNRGLIVTSRQFMTELRGAFQPAWGEVAGKYFSAATLAELP